VDYGAPPFLFSTRHSRAGDAAPSAPTLRSTCGCYLANAPAIFGAASVYRAAAQLGHSVQVAERHYLGTLRRIPASATTLEAAMEIEAALAEITASARRLQVV
jgi:integrase